MPKAILDKLPSAAKDIYEAAWKEAKEKAWDDEKSAKYAIGAVKAAGYQKDDETGDWSKMSEPVFLVFGEPVTDGRWIEVACTGDVVDMGGRQLSITPADFDRWVSAYEENERGQDLPITIDHPKQGGVAAGWFKGLRKGPRREIRGSVRDTLVMQPSWTPLGQSKVGDGEYKYFSLEIAPGNILRGGSLVNFPAIKGLKAVTEGVQFGEFYLREFYMAEGMKCPECQAPVLEGSEACPSCGADIELKEKESYMSEENEQVNETPQVGPDFEAQLAEMRAELQESMSKQLGEADAKIAALAEEKRELAEQVDRLAEINDLLRLSDKVNDFMALEDKPELQIAPAFAEQIINVLLAAPTVEDDILALLRAIASKDAVVELGERGTSSAPALKADGVSVTRMELHNKALKLSEESDQTYTEALIELSKEGLNG